MENADAPRVGAAEGGGLQGCRWKKCAGLNARRAFLHRQRPQRVREDRGGEAIDSYHIHHLSATLSRDAWRVQAYIDNIWDEYYITGTRTSRRFLQDERRGPGTSINGFNLRSYGQYVGLPRNIGLKVTYSFDN